MRSFMHFTSHQILSRWTRMMMGWGTYRDKRETCTGFWWENRTEGDHLQDLGVCGTTILKSILKKFGRRGVDWVISGKGGVLAYEEMNLRVTENARTLLIGWGTIAFSRRTPPNGGSNMSLKHLLGHDYITISITLTLHMVLTGRQHPHRHPSSPIRYGWSSCILRRSMFDNLFPYFAGPSSRAV